MSLSDAKVRNAVIRSKPYKLADGEGMFLLVTPSGNKCWRLKYRFIGKEKTLALGMYPAISLMEARKRRLQARETLAAGNDPGVMKQAIKRMATINDGNSFKAIALEWHVKRKNKWNPRTAKITMARMEHHVFAAIGHRPITDIAAPAILEMLRVIEQRGTLETAHRVKQIVGQVFLFAIATARADRNPVPDLDGALETPITKHHAYLKAAELPKFLKKLASYDGDALTKCALRLLSFTFVRTLELRGAQWEEFNLKKKEWRIPLERMKMKVPHIVPLSHQAIAVLRELQKLTGDGHYLFPNRQTASGYMSENTMLYALYRMGYHSKATGHGFRSTASTILNENDFMPDVIERQLAHTERDKVRAAYNHAQYLPQRREMMQWWADYLDEAAKKPDRSTS